MPPEPALPAVRPGRRYRCLDRLADLHPEVVALRLVDPTGPGARLWVVADGGTELVCRESDLQPLDREGA